MAATTKVLEFLGRGVPEIARTHLLKNKAWIAGEWSEAISKKSFPVYNPSNQQLIAEVPDMGEEDVEVTIQEAYTAQKKWAALTAKERSVILKMWNSLMLENRNDMAKIVSLECGKPLLEALLEVNYGSSMIEWFAEEARRTYGDIVPTYAKEKRLLIIKQPVGVAALITPWNFPIAMVTRKLGAALAAGCSAIVKPSEETPFSSLAMAELAHQAGIPPGVLNVVTSSEQSTPSVGEALCSSHLVAKLSFTGSTAVGKLLMRQCADTVKRISLELGGNAPFIVFNSADVALALKHTIACKYRNAGQTCVSANRVLVQSRVHDQFVEELAKMVSGLKQGDGFEEGVNIGPLINEAAVQKVERHVADALSQGGEVVLGGSRNAELGGSFYQPSVLTGVRTDMMMAREETFGPVAGIIKFEDEEEAVTAANASQSGLASYFFTSDMGQMWRVSEALEYGLVGVNEGLLSSEVVPFSGIKESGVGIEGSKYGINEYLNVKHICVGNVQ